MEEKAVKKEDIIDINNLPKDNFNFQQMLELWNNYAILLQSQGNKLIHSAMTSNQPKLENNTIYCEVPNQAIAMQFETESTQLMQYIRKGLNNFSIQLNAIITKQEDIKLIFTSREKYNHMVKKNINLELMVHKLGLELV
ncbi:MAG: hypothetical protein KAG96_03825 [Ichthyobacteriaceae bacterium]|nr:hypothetical protein [Ichthyobacteriaceae bacterium]